jgi:hypothetical protein
LTIDDEKRYKKQNRMMMYDGTAQNSVQQKTENPEKKNGTARGSQQESGRASGGRVAPEGNGNVAHSTTYDW